MENVLFFVLYFLDMISQLLQNNQHSIHQEYLLFPAILLFCQI